MSDHFYQLGPHTKIYIGDKQLAKDYSKLKEMGIKYIINCTPDVCEGGIANFFDSESSFNYLRLPMNDTVTEVLEVFGSKAKEFVKTATIREDGDILVHCVKGLSRSVSILAYIIMAMEENPKFDHVIDKVQKVRPNATPNSGFYNQLKQMEKPT